jgi:hypothetical protein
MGQRRVFQPMAVVQGRPGSLQFCAGSQKPLFPMPHDLPGDPPIAATASTAQGGEPGIGCQGWPWMRTGGIARPIGVAADCNPSGAG